jgi:hypothetical protein
MLLNLDAATNGHDTANTWLDDMRGTHLQWLHVLYCCLGAQVRQLPAAVCCWPWQALAPQQLPICTRSEKRR